MSGSVRCACCNKPIPVTPDDVGLTVSCPRTGKLVAVKATDLMTGSPLPLTKRAPSPPKLASPPSKRPLAPVRVPAKQVPLRRGPGWVAITVPVLLLIGVAVFHAGKMVRSSRADREKVVRTEPSVAPTDGTTPTPVETPHVPIDTRPVVRIPVGPEPRPVPDPIVVAPVVPVAPPVTREETIRALAKDLKDPAKKIKTLERLATYGAEANIVGEELIEAMTDPVAEVRNAAAEALEKVNPKVYPHVFTMLHGQQTMVAFSRLEAMGSDAAIVVPLLLAWYEKPASILRTNFAQSTPMIGQIAKIAPKNKRLATIVLSLVAGPYTNLPSALRAEGLQLLDQIEASTAEKVNALLPGLAEGDISVIRTIGKYGADAKPALPLLKKLKFSPNDGIRDAATEAIKRIE